MPFTAFLRTKHAGEHQDELEAARLRELCLRLRRTSVFLAPALFMLYLVVAEAFARSLLVRAAVVVALVAVLLRVALLHRFLASAATTPRDTRRRLLVAGLATTGVGVALAAVNWTVAPLVDPTRLTLVALICAGTTSVTLASVAAPSLRAYLGYMVPILGSLAVVAPRFGGETGNLLLALVLIYAGTLVTLAVDMHRGFRHRILLSLELRDAALRDSLTGLRNRRFLVEFLEPESERVLRPWRSAAQAGTNRESLGFLVLDVDGFKAFNDTYGHDAGDAVLRQFADRLRVTARSADLVVRWGGEEFVVVARDIDRGQLRQLAERLRLRVEALPFGLPDGRLVTVTCSLGYALFPFLPAQPGLLAAGEVLTAADRALNWAKRLGRNRSIGVQASGAVDREQLRLAFAADAPPAADGGAVVLETGEEGAVIGRRSTDLR